jgi:hypothetical protein
MSNGDDVDLLIGLHLYAGPDKQLIDEAAHRIAALEAALRAIAQPENAVGLAKS